MSSMSTRIAPAFRSTPGRALLVVAWAGLIFAASNQPDLRVASSELADLIIRKSLHMVVFAILMVLLYRLLQPSHDRSLVRLGSAWILTLAYAASDEWHQTFVAGRTGQLRDVMIDMVGATIAAALLLRSGEGMHS